MTITCQVVACHACGKVGRFHSCQCSFRKPLGVAGLPVCDSCERGQRHIAKFLFAILSTSRQERGNSARSRLFNALNGVVCANIRSGGGRAWRDAKFVIDGTGPLDSDEANFKRCVSDAIKCLPMTEETGRELRNAEFEIGGGGLAFLTGIAANGQRAV